ncbi:MAG TPA: radical SAM protein [Pyrinomonadaceae bacterium]|nr:radical SAM protein [Pyrinomonadaceae bacterium]
MKKKELVQIGTSERRSARGVSARLPSDVKVIYSFGKTVEELKDELRSNVFFSWVPDEVWITSIMSYWWESTRDVVKVCRQYYPDAVIRVGGIYPTLAPDHAAKNLGLPAPLVISGESLDLRDQAQLSRHLIVKGEIPSANDLPLDLELYSEAGTAHPSYTILTTSRGCPRDCEYCAAYVLSGRKVRARNANSVIEEIGAKYEQGVRDFCFYEDNLLMAKKNFQEILEGIIERKREWKGIELHSPEGLEIRLVDFELAKLMKEAGFRRIYLPLESINHDFIAKFERNFYNLQHFDLAVSAFERAGFTKPQDINVFVLFGLPGEDLQHVYDTAIYAANRAGSVIPMLFAPVPGTPLFEKLRSYIDERGFDFQDLNGKLLPFLEYNRREMRGRYDLKVEDYYDVEAFMFRLNQKVREKTFRPGAETRVSQAFRKVFVNYETVFDGKTRKARAQDQSANSDPSELITEFHGGGESTKNRKLRKNTNLPVIRVA